MAFARLRAASAAGPSPAAGQAGHPSGSRTSLTPGWTSTFVPAG